FRAFRGAAASSADLGDDAASGTLPGSATLGGRAQRIALELFAAVCERIRPHKARRFALALLGVLDELLRAESEDVLLLDCAGARAALWASSLVPPPPAAGGRRLVAAFFRRLGRAQPASRRALAAAVAAVVRRAPQRRALLVHALGAVYS